MSWLFDYSTFRQFENKIEDFDKIFNETERFWLTLPRDYLFSL